MLHVLIVVNWDIFPNHVCSWAKLIVPYSGLGNTEAELGFCPPCENHNHWARHCQPKYRRDETPLLEKQEGGSTVGPQIPIGIWFAIRFPIKTSVRFIQSRPGNRFIFLEEYCLFTQGTLGSTRLNLSVTKKLNLPGGSKSVVIPVGFGDFHLKILLDYWERLLKFKRSYCYT